MNKISLSDNHIRFILWLTIVIERSGLSCEACEGRFMIRHGSGLPLAEEVLHDVLDAIKDEADRLFVPVDVNASAGKIWLTLVEKSDSED